MPDSSRSNTGSDQYWFHECPVCEWTCVTERSVVACCLICFDDSGKEITMSRRSALPTDKPEGFDVRQV